MRFQSRIEQTRYRTEYSPWFYNNSVTYQTIGETQLGRPVLEELGFNTRELLVDVVPHKSLLWCSVGKEELLVWHNHRPEDECKL